MSIKHYILPLLLMISCYSFAQKDTLINNKERNVTLLTFGLDVYANLVVSNITKGYSNGTFSPQFVVQFSRHSLQIGPDIYSLSSNIIGIQGGYTFDIYKHNKYSFFTGFKWQSVKYISGVAQNYNINYIPEQGYEDLAIFKNKVSFMSFGLGCRKNIWKYLNVNIMLGYGLNTNTKTRIEDNTKELINANHLLLNVGLGTKLYAIKRKD